MTYRFVQKNVNDWIPTTRARKKKKIVDLITSEDFWNYLIIVYIYFILNKYHFAKSNPGTAHASGTKLC